MRKVDTVLGRACKVGKKEATIIGQMSWNNKIQYVWVIFIKEEDLIKFSDVRLCDE